MLAWPRLIWALAVPFIATVDAQDGSRRQRSAAEVAFDRLDLHQRVDLQTDLIATGYLTTVPATSFHRGILEGLVRFQRDRGLPETGVLTSEARRRLLTEASVLYRSWRFRHVSHPTKGRPIWMPTGLGLAERSSAQQIAYQDADERMSAAYRYLPQELGRTFEDLVRKYRQNGSRVHYVATKPDWFVISLTDPNGNDGYIRYHRDGNGISGFAFFWNVQKGALHGERVAVLMSASLRARMTGDFFISPPNLDRPPEPRQFAASPPAESPRAPEAPPVPAAQAHSGPTTGTAFFISGDGRLVTNAHVVDGCGTITIRTSDRATYSAHLLARDGANDLAILQAPVQPARVAPLRRAARLGDTVAAFGYPHSDMLSSGGNFTQGSITATSGLGDDSRFFQVSAPVQSGNSGGPLVDARGHVVGVVTAKLNAFKVALRSGDLPQNVNFALKASQVTTFLDSHGIQVAEAAAGSPILEPADLAEAARTMSAQVVCR